MDDRWLGSYEVTDGFFGAPFVDLDEERDDPHPHRYVHGGFEGTDTRFAVYLPPPEAYGGRFLHCIGGGRGGSEHSTVGPVGGVTPHLELARRHHAYFVDSNQGHIGADNLCPKAGDDASIYGYRASAESARFARHVATQLYGKPPRHGFMFGSSGGANRAIACLEQVEGLWDGALINSGFGNHRRGFRNSSALIGAVRSLGDRLADVVDAMDVGGSGDPFGTLTTLQRDRLADVYRLGFCRGAEASFGGEFGTATWTLLAEELMGREPEYFRAYWSEPGYRGHDQLAGDVFDVTTTVLGTQTKAELAERFTGPGTAPRPIQWRGPEDVIGVTVADAFPSEVAAFTVTVLSGGAAGRMVQTGGRLGEVLLAAPWQAGDGQEFVFAGIEPGDEVRIENRPLLAFCDWYRHHVLDGPGFDFLRVDGAPMYPQHPHVDVPAPQFGETPATGRYVGKVIMLNPLHGTPTDRILYQRAVDEESAGEGEERLRLWSIEHGEYQATPADSTRHVDYSGIASQAMTDLIAWVEHGTRPPASTAYSFDDGNFTMADAANQRCGIQPVVRLRANGGPRAEVAVGDRVVLEIEAEAAPGTGTVVSAQCDFDGSSTWAHVEAVDPATTVAFSVTHAYAQPGTYFPAALVAVHRDGDADDSVNHVHNLARARVVVS